MVKNTSIAILVCGFFLTGACAASTLPEHILEAYQLGIQGNAQENKTAINALKEINENAPDPFALAMLGSAEATQAKYTR